MRQELCSHRFRAAIGDTFCVKGTSTDRTKFVVNGDLFRNEDPVAHWSHAQTMDGTAKHVLSKAGTYVAIVDVAYLAKGAVDFEFSVERAENTTTKSCSFTGDKKGDLDSGLVSIVVS